MNREEMEQATRRLLAAMGRDIAGDDIAETPSRVAEMWADELLSGYATDPVGVLTWQPAGGEKSLVVVRDIEFTSVCMHHLLPFTGVAGVAYLPAERLCGLSKMARLVDCLSRRLQMQERLTTQILDAVVRALEPRGAACLIVATHQCMACRGVRQMSARVATVRFHGECEAPPGRDEVLRLLDAGGMRG